MCTHDFSVGFCCLPCLWLVFCFDCNSFFLSHTKPDAIVVVFFCSSCICTQYNFLCLKLSHGFFSFDVFVVWGILSAQKILVDACNFAVSYHLHFSICLNKITDFALSKNRQIQLPTVADDSHNDFHSTFRLNQWTFEMYFTQIFERRGCEHIIISSQHLLQIHRNQPNFQF